MGSVRRDEACASGPRHRPPYPSSPCGRILTVRIAAFDAWHRRIEQSFVPGYDVVLVLSVVVSFAVCHQSLPRGEQAAATLHGAYEDRCPVASPVKYGTWITCKTAYSVGLVTLAMPAFTCSGVVSTALDA